MTPEGKVKATVKALLKSQGVYYFMPVSNGMGAMGVFDIVCCCNGVFLGVECKSDAKKPPTPLQTRNARIAQNAGAVVFLAHAGNVTDLARTIDQIKGDPHGATQYSFWPADRAGEDN